MDGTLGDEKLEGEESTPPRAPVRSIGAPVFQMQLKSMRQLLGDEGYERGLERMPAALAERVRTAPALGWVPFELVESVVTAMAEEAREPIEVFQLDMVRATTAQALTGVWRLLARFTSRKAILRRVGTYWRKTFSHGNFQFSSERDGVVVWNVIDLDDASDYMLRGVAFSVRSLLEHTGKRVLEVTWTRTPGGAEYAVRWQP